MKMDTRWLTPTSAETQICACLQPHGDHSAREGIPTILAEDFADHPGDSDRERAKRLAPIVGRGEERVRQMIRQYRLDDQEN